MPFVRISLPEGKPADYRRAIADGVHIAMRNPQSWAVFSPAPNFRRWMISKKCSTYSSHLRRSSTFSSLRGSSQ